MSSDRIEDDPTLPTLPPELDTEKMMRDLFNQFATLSFFTLGSLALLNLIPH